MSAAFSSIASGRVANRKPAPSSSSTSVLARSFKPGIAARKLGALVLVELGCDLGPARQIGQGVDQRLEKLVVARRAHEMAVHVLELGEVEARGRAADRRQVEGGDDLVGGEELLVAMAPAEPHEIVAQGRRQVAHGAIGVDAERAVALRQLRAVRPVDQRDMRP